MGSSDYDAGTRVSCVTALAGAWDKQRSAWQAANHLGMGEVGGSLLRKHCVSLKDFEHGRKGSHLHFVKGIVAAV